MNKKHLGIGMAGLAGITAVIWSSLNHDDRGLTQSYPAKQTAASAQEPGRANKAQAGPLPNSGMPSESRNDLHSAPPAQASNPKLVGHPENQPQAASLETIALEYAQTPAQSGEPVASRLIVGNQNYLLTPNQLGVFQRVYVQPEQVSSIQVSYEKGEPGQRVAVELEDGGKIIEADGPLYVGKLDRDRNLSFKFQVTQQQGIYRVVLSKGADVKQLELWVGSPSPVASAK